MQEVEPLWKPLVDGPNGRVMIHAECLKEMQSLPDRNRSKIEANMKRLFCGLEHLRGLSSEKFNNEGTVDGFALQAFKDFQSRVYGAIGSVDDVRTFFAAHATVKKKNKADPKALKRAARRLVSAREIEGSKL